MISKEKLLNGYIENDQGELRRLFVNAAKEYGYEVTEGIDWLDWKFIYVDKPSKEIATSIEVEKDTKLTIEDFVDTPSETTKEVFMEVKDCTSTSLDIFQQMLTLAEQNSMLIQFDGFTQGENDTIVVTKQGSDTEYVVENKQEFDQLIESFNVLEKFERK